MSIEKEVSEMHTQPNNGKDSLPVRSPFYYLSEYRTELMGIAILWVVLFHSDLSFAFIHNSFIHRAMMRFSNIGYGGVDIFLLLSGMGVYVSLDKNDISTFIRNRIRRIIPVWWLYLLICIILGFFVSGIRYTGLEIIGFLTFTGYWLDMANQGSWYVYAIMLFYLISPVLHSLLKHSGNRTRTCIGLLIVSLMMAASFLTDSRLIVFSRLPIFIIGMYISSALRNISIDKKQWILILTAFVFGNVLLLVSVRYFHDYLWPYGLWWYPFILIAPSLSLLLAKCFDMSDKYVRPLCRLFSVFGRSSLEILLISNYFFDHFVDPAGEWFSEETAIILVSMVAVVLGIAFHYGVEIIKKKFSFSSLSSK